MNGDFHEPDYKIAVIGAGKTGRGFIGRLLAEAGEKFLLIDKNAALIKRLGDAGHFEVSFFGDVREPMTVGGFCAINTMDPAVGAALRNVSLVFVSVGGSNLAETARFLAGNMEGRLKDSTECTVVTCENAIKPAAAFKDAFLAELPEADRDHAARLFGFSEAAVFCTTIEREKDSLDIHSEDFPDLPCDATAIKGNMPRIAGVKPVAGFENLLMRKIYTYNAASGIISYLGWLKGYEAYADAANDADILAALDVFYTEIGKALCAEYGYDEADQREFAARSLKKFTDRTIADTIERNAREPRRKLDPSERIISPALLIEKYGGDNKILAETAAAALLYDDGPEWAKLKEELGAEGILREISGLKPGSPLFTSIIKYSDMLCK